MKNIMLVILVAVSIVAYSQNQVKCILYEITHTASGIQEGLTLTNTKLVFVSNSNDVYITGTLLETLCATAIKTKKELRIFIK